MAGYAFVASYPVGRTTLYWTVLPATFFVLSTTSARNGTAVPTTRQHTSGPMNDVRDLTNPPYYLVAVARAGSSAVKGPLAYTTLPPTIVSTASMPPI